MDEFLVNCDVVHLAKYRTVVISCGVNDLSRYLHSARSLHEHVSHHLPRLLQACPHTTFIFRALTEVDIDGLNSEIIAFNIMMFSMSGDFENLFFYDTSILPTFRGHYLNLSQGSKGIHLQQWAAIELYSNLISHAIYLATDSPRVPPPGQWPLRPFYCNL